MTITLRQESDARATTKGTSLTFQELDNNFIDILNRSEFTVEGDSGEAQLSTAATEDRRLVVNGAGGLTTAISTDSTGQAVLTLTQAASVVDIENAVFGGTGITVSSPDSTGAVTITNDGLVDLVDDTTPQLGGQLSANGNDIDMEGNQLKDAEMINYKEDVYALSYAATITPDVANGNVQKITLTGNLTFSAFSNPEAGQSMTLIIDTNGTSRTLTSTMLFQGGEKTLSTTDTVDIMTVFYDGTSYYASLANDFS